MKIANPTIMGLRIVRLFELQKPYTTVLAPLHSQNGMARSAANRGSFSKRAPVLKASAPEQK